MKVSKKGVAKPQKNSHCSFNLKVGRLLENPSTHELLSEFKAALSFFFYLFFAVC